MTAKVTANREAILKAATLVRPAVASQAYVPSLTHIWFSGEWLTAYNDVTAIGVKGPDLGLECCVPGDMLIKTLNSFTASEIAVQENVKEGSLLLSAGRPKLKLHTLPAKDYPFEWPSGNSTKINLDDKILKGIERCLISVGSDPTHPAQMGVTLATDDDGCAVLYSTDNFTISRYAAKTEIKLPADTPIILPTFFCEQLVLLSKQFDEDVKLHIMPGCLMAVVGSSAQLFTKMVDELEAVDFEKMISRYFKVTTIKKVQQRIPDGFEPALSRALLVLSSNADKVTKVTCDGEVIKLATTSDLGDATDSLPFDGDDAPTEPFFMDPGLVARASKVCSFITLMEKVLVLSNEDASFVHMIAHCSE